MKKATILFALLLFAVSQGTFAQRTITGRAIDAEDGIGIPGVSVVVKGTTTATRTNAVGNFSLIVPNNRATIIVSFIGFKTVEVPVGSYSQFDIKLEPDPVTLGEVVVTARRNHRERVVTAMGIERDIKSLPYVVYHFSGDEIRKTGHHHVLNALVGKVPNFTVIRWGQGAGAPLVAYGRLGLIRLYVINGMPIQLGVETDRFNRVINVTNDVISWISLDIVESIIVLPSANATMLYGSMGSGGAIVITTKK